MYERFTDRARRVLQLANQEAQRFNHDHIGTEHILLGLIKEGSGIAATILKNLDVDLRKVRIEVEKLVTPGPDMITMGKLPSTPAAKKIIEFAIEEAKGFQHNYIGTEHLLLGLLRTAEMASKVLNNLGLKVEDIREEVVSLLGHKETSSDNDLHTSLISIAVEKGVAPVLAADIADEFMKKTLHHKFQFWVTCQIDEGVVEHPSQKSGATVGLPSEKYLHYGQTSFKVECTDHWVNLALGVCGRCGGKE